MYYEDDNKIGDIIKLHTNGLITYSINENGENSYRSYISFPANFIIVAENHANGWQYRHTKISDFGVDLSLLPSSDDLASYEPPKSLVESKMYVKW